MQSHSVFHYKHTVALPFLPDTLKRSVVSLRCVLYSTTFAYAANISYSLFFFFFFFVYSLSFSLENSKKCLYLLRNISDNE